MTILTDEEQADQNLAMTWANETIPSWRNVYDLIRRIRAEAAAKNTRLGEQVRRDANGFANLATALNAIAARAADACLVTMAGSLRIVVAGVQAAELEARDALPASDNPANRQPRQDP